LQAENYSLRIKPVSEPSISSVISAPTTTYIDVGVVTTPRNWDRAYDDKLVIDDEVVYNEINNHAPIYDTPDDGLSNNKDIIVLHNELNEHNVGNDIVEDDGTANVINDKDGDDHITSDDKSPIQSYQDFNDDITLSRQNTNSSRRTSSLPDYEPSKGQLLNAVEVMLQSDNVSRVHEGQHDSKVIDVMSTDMWRLLERAECQTMADEEALTRLTYVLRDMITTQSVSIIS
jgi:hypothetical protein